MNDPVNSPLPVAQPLRIGVLGSGTGSNFRAIVEAIHNGSLSATVACVGSDVSGAGILDYARINGFPTFSIPTGKFKSSLEPYLESRLVYLLNEHNVELVVLAGFMRILKHQVLEAYRGRIINIHPSLLPKFKGMFAWKQALNSGDTITGCTVHYVDSGVDTGEIIAQAEVDILADDTPETLHERIQKAEHRLLPTVIEKLSRDRWALLDHGKVATV